MKLRRTKVAGLCAACICTLCHQAIAYGPSGHMRVVIENWNEVMAPNLDGQPLTNKELVFAALVGSVSSDIGQVIPQARPFTCWVHYVRPGDFVTALIREARSGANRKDSRLLAFALGFQTHYWADRYGHYFGTNVLVARIRNEQMARFTYEGDPGKHKWVETQLGLFDSKDAPKILETGFVEAIDQMHGEQNAFLSAAYRLLESAVRDVFPGANLAFTAYDLYRFLRFVAASLCLAQETVKGVFIQAPPCMDLLKMATANSQERGGLDNLQADLKNPLPLDPDLTRSVYEDSLKKVREHMISPGSNREDEFRLPNFNLDTNLPSEAGQYRLADAAFYSLASQVQNAPSGSLSNVQAVGNFLQTYSNFTKAGRRARQLFDRPLGERPQESLLSRAELKEEIKNLLFDISPLAEDSKPGIEIQPLKCCSFEVGLGYRVGSQLFLLDATKRMLCMPEKTRSLEALYGYWAAYRFLKEPRIPGQRDVAVVKSVIQPTLKKFLEALDRTRLDEKVDTKSGLFTADPSANCECGTSPCDRQTLTTVSGR